MAGSATDTVKRMSEVRSELEGLGEKLGGLRAKERSDETFAEMKKVVDEIGFLDHQLKVIQRSAEVELLEKSLEATPGDGPRGGTRAAETADFRSSGERFVDNDEYKAWTERGSGNFELEVRTLLDSTGGISWATDADNGVGLLRPIGTPSLPPQTIRRTRLFMRDVLTSTNTTLALVPYIQELNAEAIANASGAFFVNEGAQKPEVALSFQPADAPIRKIAAWIPATYEILQDAPTLRGYIDQRLQYMVALREEKAILNGSGTAPEIRGIRQQSGKQTQSAVANDPFATIGSAIGKLEIVDGEASFVAMNPGDYWATVVGRHSTQFDGQTTNGPAPYNTPPAQVWGVPVVRTNSIETTKVLIGCRQGAVILDREGTTIRVGDQHLDYFTTNKVAILAEKRMGLAVHRPDWFVEATISLP